MKIKPEVIDDLREFVDLVNGLKKSRLSQKVLSTGSISLRLGNEKYKPEIVNFDEEDCRSFLLQCRMLVQNNDRVSIFKMWEFFQTEISDPTFWVKINPPRWQLNDFFDQPCLIAAPNGEEVTHRLVFDTFMYGVYAHLNRDHRARFKEWEKDSRQFPALKLQFLMVLKVLLKAAAAMEVVVSEWLNSDRSASVVQRNEPQQSKTV